jgi:L-ribulose-5-phosphate 4-epimerase
MNLQESLVAACHILVNQQLDSGPFGNLSIRVPETQTFMINPQGIYFNKLIADDIVTVSIDGTVLSKSHLPHPGEVIHRAIYQKRTDVNAIVHVHSTHTVAISLLSEPIQAFTQVGASLYGDQGIFHGFSGPVRDTSEGEAIAEALGQHAIVIAKNHGLFAASHCLSAALWDMMVADMAAAVHLQALSLGIRQATPLTQAELQKSKTEVRDNQHQSVWQNLIQC